MKIRTLGTTNSISLGYAKNSDWCIHQIVSSQFYVDSADVRVCFEAEGRNGATYTKIISAWDKNSGRVYQAERYLRKYIPLVTECGYILATHNYLWDYVLQCPLIESREKALKPYYDKCEELGISK